MSHRMMGQMSLAESIVARRKPKHWLEAVYELVDWERLAERLAEMYAAREGRPSYPPIVMLRALLLQQWHRLSDPELEAALEDRISFRQFAGLPFDEQVPDRRSMSRCPTIRPSAGFARSWRRGVWMRRCSAKSARSLSVSSW